MIHRISHKEILHLIAGALLVIGLYSIAAILTSESSRTEFCMQCHEMRVVAEQGWMKSKHFDNESGVVAQCEDCHIPPELVNKMWTKTRDGSKDIFAHFFGESDPDKMDWLELRDMARSKISDSACKKCHENMTPKGANIKMIIAHRAYQRLDGRKKCLDCHREQFHGKFREYLTDNSEY